MDFRRSVHNRTSRLAWRTPDGGETNVDGNERRNEITVAIDPAVADLVPKYLSRCGQDLAAIRALLPTRDFAAIRALGDRMAGSGTAYGFAEVSDRGFEIEAAAQKGDSSTIEVALVALEHYVKSVKVVYRERKGSG